MRLPAIQSRRWSARTASRRWSGRTSASSRSNSEAKPALNPACCTLPNTALVRVPQVGKHRGNRPIEPHPRGVGRAAHFRGNLLPGEALCFQVEDLTCRFVEPVADRRGEVLVLDPFANVRLGAGT